MSQRMSRKVKTRPLLPWLSANMDCVDRRFVQIGNSFMLDSRTQNLSAGAKLRSPFYFWTDTLQLRQFHYVLNETAKYDKVNSKIKKLYA